MDVNRIKDLNPQSTDAAERNRVLKAHAEAMKDIRRISRFRVLKGFPQR